MKQKELTLMFLIRGEEILLAMKKRGFGVGKWNGVGGKVEDGETTEQALIRECKEEIFVTPKQYIKVARLVFDEIHESERKLMNVNVYLCNEWDGDPQESEEMKPQWFKQSDIPFDECWSDDKYWLPLVLQGKYIEAKFTMNDKNEVLDHTINVVPGFK